jgi:hypothetical protein
VFIHRGGAGFGSASAAEEDLGVDFECALLHLEFVVGADLDNGEDSEGATPFLCCAQTAAREDCTAERTRGRMSVSIRLRARKGSEKKGNQQLFTHTPHSEPGCVKGKGQPTHLLKCTVSPGRICVSLAPSIFRRLPFFCPSSPSSPSSPRSLRLARNSVRTYAALIVHAKAFGSSTAAAARAGGCDVTAPGERRSN